MWTGLPGSEEFLFGGVSLDKPPALLRFGSMRCDHRATVNLFNSPPDRSGWLIKGVRLLTMHAIARPG
jgi:hypothetical protein